MKKGDDCTNMLTRLRNDKKAAESFAREAEVLRDKASTEAENLREQLHAQESDSGRIVAYEDAIQVPLVCE